MTARCPNRQRRHTPSSWTTPNPDTTLLGLYFQQPARRLPFGVVEDTDRHGNIRLYYRAKGRPKKVRLRGVPWTPEFMAEYEAAKNATPIRAPKGITPGSWQWLCVQYFSSIEFKQLKSRTQQERRWILESTFDEPIAPGSNKLFKDFP